MMYKDMVGVDEAEYCTDKRVDTCTEIFNKVSKLLESLFESEGYSSVLFRWLFKERCAWFGVVSFSGVHRQEVRHLRAALQPTTTSPLSHK
jgi:hypothetical protein